MAINWQDIGQGASAWGNRAWDGVQRGAGATWSGVQQVPGAAWNASLPLSNGSTLPVGKIGLGAAGVYGGTRFVAYPALTATGVISPETQEYIGNNGLGRFITGEREIDPLRTQAILEGKAEEAQKEADARAIAEQQRLWEQEKIRTEYMQNSAYQQAERMGELGLGLGNVQTWRDVNAGMLRDSTKNYIDAMRVGNDMIGRILSPAPAVI